MAMRATAILRRCLHADRFNYRTREKRKRDALHGRTQYDRKYGRLWSAQGFCCRNCGCAHAFYHMWEQARWRLDNPFLAHCSDENGDPQLCLECLHKYWGRGHWSDDGDKRALIAVAKIYLKAYTKYRRDLRRAA